MRIDLHGYTVDEAYSVVGRVIEECYYSGAKTVEIITGRSGEIHREFPMWIENNRYVRDFYEIARRRGMFNVTLRKKK